MTGKNILPDNAASALAEANSATFSRRRCIPLAVVIVASGVILLMGWHRELSFETLVRHHEALREFIGLHAVYAVTVYIVLYVTVVALSLPAGIYLTVIGGILFGTALGGTAAVIGATGGAVLIFLIARSAVGEHLVRRAGAVAQKLAQGFRAEAFSYLLFLRLVPLFPFWLVNLVPAVCGVGLATYTAATVVGIIPATYAFAFVGAGLDSVVTAQQAAYQSCLALGRDDCRLTFHLRDAITPDLLAALAVLGVLALIPIVVRRSRALRSPPSQAEAPRDPST